MLFGFMLPQFLSILSPVLFRLEYKLHFKHMAAIKAGVALHPIAFRTEFVFRSFFDKTDKIIGGKEAFHGVFTAAFGAKHVFSPFGNHK